jgi:phosphatidylserine decarboxylase
MDKPESRARIAPFIAQYGLDESEFAEPTSSYATFNDFFYRKLKPSARPIHADLRSVVFPADGRHLLIGNIAECADFFVKGVRFDLNALLGDSSLAKKFSEGSLLISRLCPVDYHRFHFPCAGTASEPVLINGPLYSVSPIAIATRPGILWENKRCVTRVSSPLLGEVLYLEIGATCVGSIVHTSTPGAVGKGDEKGYFRFGGSCVITVFEPGRVTWDADLIEHGREGREVYAKIGERAGVA